MAFGEVAATGGGRGFTLGPVQNVFTGADRAAAEAARDAYAVDPANSAWLPAYNADTSLNIRLEYADGTSNIATYQVRNSAGNAWLDNQSFVAVAGQDGDGADLSGVSNNRVPFVQNGALADSPINIMSNGEAFITGTPMFESGSIDLGPRLRLREAGGALGRYDAVTQNNLTLVDFLSNRNAASRRPRRFAAIEPERDFVIQSVQDTAITSPVSMNYDAVLNAITNAFKFTAGTDITGLRFRIRNNVPLNQNVIKYFPSQEDWDAGTGVDFSAGEMVLDLGDSPLPLSDNMRVTFDIAFDSGTLLGNSSGFPMLTAVLQEAKFTFSADWEDVAHNFTEITDDFNLTTANVVANNRQSFYTPTSQSTDVTFNIATDLRNTAADFVAQPEGITEFDWVEVANFGTANLIVSAGLAGDSTTINGMKSVTLLPNQTARIVQIPNEANRYVMMFSNSGMTGTDAPAHNFLEVTADVNITNANLATYNSRTLYIAQGTNLLGVDREINLAAGLTDFEYLDIINFNPTDIIISVGTGFDGDINGEHDIRLAQFEGGRIIKEPGEDNYAFIFDNTDPDMVDNFVDTFTASVSGQNLTMTMGRTGTLPDLTQTVTLPSSSGAVMQSLVNNTGETIPAGQPVIAVVTPTGVLQMERASHTNVGSGTDATAQGGAIYGFVTEDVADGDSSTPIRSGVISGVTLNTNTQPPGSVLSIREGATYLELQSNPYVDGDYTREGGVIVSRVGTTAVHTVFVDLNLAQEGRLERLISEVQTSAGLTVDGTPTNGQYAQFTGANSLRGINSIPATDVRLFSQTLTNQATLNIDTTTEYNSHRNRRLIWVNTTGSSSGVQLPQIRSPRPSYVRTGDFFEIQYSTDSTRSSMFVDVNPGDSFGGSTRILLQQGEFIRLRVPATGNTWELVNSGFSEGTGSAVGSGGLVDDGSLTSDSIFSTEAAFFLGADKVGRANRDFELGQKLDITEEPVYTRTTGTGQSTSNPIQFTFENDLAMIAWWELATGESTLDLGQTVDSVQGGAQAAKDWITNNVNNGYQFEIEQPDVDFQITDFIFQSAGVVRCTFTGNLPAFIPSIVSVVDIRGATNPIYNGKHTISNKGASHFDLTIPSVTDSSTDETGSSAEGFLQLYCTVTAVTHATRSFSFFHYDAAARTGQYTLPLHTFDTGSSESVLGFNYLNIMDAPSEFELDGHYKQKLGTDVAGFLGAQGGIAYVDNSTTPVSSLTLPVHARDIEIQTSQNVSLFLPIKPDELEVGETRTYNIKFNGDSNYTVPLYIGTSGDTVAFDNGITYLDLQLAKKVTVQVFRDTETTSGVRLPEVTKIRKFASNAQSSAVLVSAISIAPLSIATSDLTLDEDPNQQFVEIDPAGNPDCFRFAHDGYVESHYQMTLFFNGTEPSGFSFVRMLLRPYINGQPRDGFSHESSMIFSRDGETGSSAPKYAMTVRADFRGVVSADDLLHFNLEFGTFPTGYSTSDLQVRDISYSVDYEKEAE